MNSLPNPSSAGPTLGAGFADRGGPAGNSLFVPLWILYLLTLRQHLHGKRWMVMGGLFLLSAGLVILVRVTSQDIPGMWLEFTFAFLFIPQAILPLIALIYASGIIRDEQEEQTITYLLIRPISKWALYLVKLLATLTTTVALAVALTALIYAAIYAGADTGGQNIPLRCAKAASIHALAVVAYCCLFGLISLVTKRSLIVGVLYAAVFEGLLANLPFSIRLATVIYYTRLIAYRSLEFVSTQSMAGRQMTHDLAAEAWQLDVKTDPALLEHPQIRTCLTVLMATSLFCAVIAAIVFSQREFHVKTPEKG